MARGKVKRAPFNLGDRQVPAGSRETIALELPNQSTYTPMTMPVHVVHGRKDGPVMFVSAAIHGDEINGVEIVRQLMRVKALNRLRGTLLLIPIVNVFGFLIHSRYLPDRRDLNRSFPGREHGSLASRVAYTFRTEILSKCTHGIDLHTGANHRNNLPQIRANLADPETRRLACAFGAPVVINANLRDGSLREAANESGVKSLLYEAGQALRFDPLPVKAGVRGITNVLRALDMLAPLKRPRNRIDPAILESSSWIRVQTSGIARLTAKLGQHVREGDKVGTVSDTLGEENRPIVPPVEGMIIGLNQLPIVNEGDAILHVARLGEPDTAVDALESFRQTHLEGLESSDYPSE